MVLSEYQTRMLVTEAAAAPLNDLARGEAVFFFGSVAVERGGVTRAVLSRIRLYAEAGIKVRLLLSAYRFRQDAEEAEVRRIWRLPESVEFRYFWREAVPGGEAGAPMPGVDTSREPGLTAFPPVPWGLGTIVRFYRDGDGLLVKSKVFSPDGRLHRIDYVDSSRRVTARAFFDGANRLIFKDQVNPVTSKPTLRRFFDRSGSCWLTVWLNSAGREGEAVVHLPTPVAYADFGQLFAQWADQILADSDSPVIFSDSRAWDAAVLSVRHPGTRRVAVLHNCHTERPYRASDPTRSTWKVLAENVDAFDAVVTLTHAQRGHLIDRFGASNVTVINHPAHAAHAKPATPRPARMVAIARLEHQKRLDHAIRAFGIAAEKVPEARFDIYGTGAKSAELNTLVAELRLADKVTFKGFTRKPLDEFAASQATVLSSWYEGFPLVLTEAMGVGTPVVAYDINYGPAEVIRDGVDGILIPPGDVAAMGAAMAKLLGDPDYARGLGERAREVKTRFSEQRWATEWTSLYSSLAGLPDQAGK
jgi:glycosyltransferase involved in cell wall biosynthesis